ncbi:MAG: NAD(P)H-dependent oxidoreductase [Proteobacteria bacterium]|nr:NAD(P)H-dependent oxidoreductase [Pseudomonadota bacterium]
MGGQSKRILLVYGGHAGGRTERLRAAVSAGVAAVGEELELIERPALECGTAELLAAHALLLGTPEHFGYMSGALKDFFDRTFYPAEGKTSGLPYALFVSAGNDGTGTVRAVERIATGYGWTAVCPPLIVVGEPDAAALERARELGATVAAGVAAGIF